MSTKSTHVDNGINGLQKNDSEIMPDLPVKYLKNDKCDQMYRIFSTTFIYLHVQLYFSYFLYERCGEKKTLNLTKITFSQICYR